MGEAATVRIDAHTQTILISKPRISSLARKQALAGLIFISPWAAGLMLLKLLPILASLVFSFTNFDMLKAEETQFIGLDNYAHIFRDQAVGFNFFSTLSQALLSVPLQLLAALGLAALLNSERLKNRTLLRTLFFLPSVIPATAILFIMDQGFP